MKKNIDLRKRKINNMRAKFNQMGLSKLKAPKLKNPGIENRGGSRVMNTPSLSTILKRKKMR